MGATNMLTSNLAINAIGKTWEKTGKMKDANGASLGLLDRITKTGEAAMMAPGEVRIGQHEKIAQRLGITGIDHKTYNEGLKEWKAAREAGDEAAEQAAQAKMDMATQNAQGFDRTKMVKAAFMNDQGEYSKARIGGAIAGSYMAANVVGNGSLGIPFISTASWNR